MLSFAQRVEMTEYICSIYDQIETELLQNLAQSFAASKYGGSTEWRAQMLERMGWYNRKNAAIIAKYSGKSQSAVEEIFRDLGVGALIHEETLYQTAFDRGLLPVRPVNVAESAAILQILDAATENAGSYLNLVNTTCAECAKSAYMDVVNKAYIETTTGIKDYTTSIRQAVNKLAKEGITTVTYYRKDGSKIRYPVDAAVRRNILTSIGQTTGKMQIARAGEWGCNYMEVTSHAGARPSHAEWQGQVYQINGSSAEYDNLADATGYGTGDGLKGWNCRHDMYPFIPGLSERGSFPIDQEENEKEYELTQEQRKLEREVRQLRRECVAADATGDKTAFMKSSQQLKAKEAELKEFMQTTDRTQTARVSTAGFGRSVSQKAVQANRKALQNAANGGTITDGKISRIFSPISSYRNKDGDFDIHKAKEDLAEKIETIVSQKCAPFLRAMLDEVQYVRTNSPYVVFGYVSDLDVVLYNPQHPKFGEIDFITANIHELGHRIDKKLVHADLDKSFSESVSKMEKIIDSSPDSFVGFCRHSDKDGYLSDILDAGSGGKYAFPFGHEPEIWQIKGKKNQRYLLISFLWKHSVMMKKLPFLKRIFLRWLTHTAISII